MEGRAGLGLENWVAEESRPGRLTARKGPMDQDFREAGVDAIYKVSGGFVDDED